MYKIRKARKRHGRRIYGGLEGYGADRVHAVVEAQRKTTAGGGEARAGVLTTEAEHVAVPISEVTSAMPQAMPLVPATGLRNFNIGGLSTVFLLPADLIGSSYVKAPPYGAIAAGAGVGSAGAAVAAVIAPVPLPVKILLGAISIGMAGGAVYALKKRSDNIDIESGLTQEDKMLAINTNWLESLATIRPKLLQDSVYQSYKSFNEVSKATGDNCRWMNYRSPNYYPDNSAFENEQETYPDWVDVDKVSVGVKEGNKAVHDFIKGMYDATKGGYNDPLGDIAGYRNTEAPDLGFFNDFGLLNKDGIVRCNNSKFMASAIPPIKGGTPYFYHVFQKHSYTDNTCSYTEKFINPANGLEIDKARIPRNAVIIGSRIMGDIIPDQWTKLPWEGASYTGPRFEDLANLPIIKDLGLGKMDLTYLLTRPAFPASWQGSFPEYSNLEGYNSPYIRPVGDFIQGNFFQPFGLNCRSLCFGVEEFLQTYSYIGAAWDDSASGAIIRLCAVVISIVAAVVTTVATWGAATIPAWAATVTVITAALVTAMNLAATYIEGGAGALIAAIPEALKNLWGTVKSSFGNMSTGLDTHFNRAALIFIQKVKAFTGTAIEETEGVLGQVRDAMKTVGCNIADDLNWKDVYNFLKPIIPQLPDINNDVLKKIQDAIVDGTSGTNGTEQKFIEAKKVAEDAVKTKIFEMNGTLNNRQNKIGMVSLLY